MYVALVSPRESSIETVLSRPLNFEAASCRMSPDQTLSGGPLGTNLVAYRFGQPVASSGNAYVPRSGQVGFRLEF